VDAGESRACPACGAHDLKAACARCGAELLEAPREETLRDFLREAFHYQTHWDNKLIRTLRPLLLSPGKLTAEYLAGRSGRYAKPLQLFILLNLVFFLVAARIGYFRWELPGYLHARPDRVAQLASAAQRSGLPPAVVEDRAQHGLDERKKLLFLFAIPVFALALAALHPRRRSLLTHLVFSIHYHAWLLIYLALILPLALVLAGLAAKALGAAQLPAVLRGEGTLGGLIALGTVLYLFPALRAIYGTSRVRAVLEGLALSGVGFASLLAWRMLILPWTIWSL
jgi:hypothetical protein